MKTELYFAYGSNMDFDQLEFRIPNEFNSQGVGRLDNWEWIINERGYANIIPKVDSQTFGVLFNISLDALRRLDRYEGYPELYTRERLPVYFGKQLLEPWVYMDLNNKTPGAPRSGYLERIIISAMRSRLPHQYIIHLVSALPY